MKLEIADQQKRLPIPVAKVKSLVARILKSEKRALDLSLAFVSNRVIHRLNRRFLKHDFTTDVLSFPLSDTEGEVVISTDYASVEAKRRAIPAQEELLRYVAHGVLHLLGYDDHAPADRRRMWERQERYLRNVP